MDENEEERVGERVCVCVHACRERNRKHGAFNIFKYDTVLHIDLNIYIY